MKHMDLLKTVIMVLAAACLLCAVAAFFLPNAQGMVLSCLAIALAVGVLVMCTAALFSLLLQRNAAA